MDSLLRWRRGFFSGALREERSDLGKTRAAIGSRAEPCAHLARIGQPMLRDCAAQSVTSHDETGAHQGTCIVPGSWRTAGQQAGPIRRGELAAPEETAEPGPVRKIWTP